MYRIDSKISILETSRWFPNRSTDATIHCRHKLRQLVNEFFTMIFYVTVNYVLYWLNSSLCKCSFCFTHCRVNFKVSFFAKFFENSSIFCFFINPKLLKSVFSRNQFLKACKVSLAYLVFIVWTLTNRERTSTATNKYLTPFFDSLVCTLMPCPYTKYHWYILKTFENVWLEDQNLYMMSWFVKIVLPSFMPTRLLYSSFAQNRTQLYP